eukprot:CAMPEP_0179893408 /NCGR_PEP_ID=MMETSP0982-20121206/34761_1 /TAXON_ID=483367 /ORGANISM="non described non described, Strain CCMP 2436" /LENGTH=86 /DNA_ID=CAMNT_0021789979 /DNA_START=149 /DNA_END=409 /DNA_ORIENTATION=+
MYRSRYSIDAVRSLMQHDSAASSSLSQLCSAQIFQNFGMTIALSHCKASVHVPGVAVLVRVSQHLEVPSLSSIVAGHDAPRAAVLV